jgi:hypothetical protein
MDAERATGATPVPAGIPARRSVRRSSVDNAPHPSSAGVGGASATLEVDHPPPPRRWQGSGASSTLEVDHPPPPRRWQGLWRVGHTRSGSSATATATATAAARAVACRPRSGEFEEGPDGPPGPTDAAKRPKSPSFSALAPRRRVNSDSVGSGPSFAALAGAGGGESGVTRGVAAPRTPRPRAPARPAGRTRRRPRPGPSRRPARPRSG